MKSSVTILVMALLMLAFLVLVLQAPLGPRAAKPAGTNFRQLGRQTRS